MFKQDGVYFRVYGNTTDVMKHIGWIKIPCQLDITDPVAVSFDSLQIESKIFKNFALEIDPDAATPVVVTWDDADNVPLRYPLTRPLEMEKIITNELLPPDSTPSTIQSANFFQAVSTTTFAKAPLDTAQTTIHHYCIDKNSIITTNGYVLIEYQNTVVPQFQDTVILHYLFAKLFPKKGMCQLGIYNHTVTETSEYTGKKTCEQLEGLFIEFDYDHIQMQIFADNTPEKLNDGRRRFPSWRRVLYENTNNYVTKPFCKIAQQDAQAIRKHLKKVPEYRRQHDGRSYVAVTNHNGRLCVESLSYDQPNIRLQCSTRSTTEVSEDHLVILDKKIFDSMLATDLDLEFTMDWDSKDELPQAMLHIKSSSYYACWLAFASVVKGTEAKLNKNSFAHSTELGVLRDVKNADTLESKEMLTVIDLTSQLIPEKEKKQVERNTGIFAIV
jgi:hypothetical protein